jgi:putative ABC transport system substrate-binding protein
MCDVAGPRKAHTESHKKLCDFCRRFTPHFGPSGRSKPLRWRSTVFFLFLWALAGAVSLMPIEAHTQESKMLRVGAVSFQPKAHPIYVAFLKRLAELGYEEGRNFTFDFMTVGRSKGSVESAFRKIVERKVNILLAGGPEFKLKSVIAAAGSLPIVMVAVDYDPLARGYVSSLARPGGNITGLVFQQIELTRKRLQLMREASPAAKSATVFWDQISADQWQAAQVAADALEFPIHGVELRDPPYDFDRALAGVPAEYRGALMVLASPMFTLPARRRLPDFALRHKMPSMFFVRYYPDAGGLMSYGASFTDMFARAAEYVDLIAKGSKPADLPIEQPTRFELVVNLKTAKSLGITIPPAILLRADEVLE